MSLFADGDTNSNDGILKNQRSAHAHQARLHDRHSATTTINGKTVRTLPHSGIKVVAVPISIQQNAETIPSGCFVTPNIFFDIELVRTEMISYADHVILQLQVSNNDPVNALTLGHFWQLWDKIEIMPDGSTVQDTIYPEMMYIMHNMDTADEYRAQVAPNYGQQYSTNRDPTVPVTTHLNYDAALNGQGVVIPVGGNYTYFAEIPNIMFSSHVFMPAIAPKRYPRIRFYPSPSNFYMSGSASQLAPAILQALFVINGPSYIPAINRKLADTFDRFPAVSSGLVMDRQIIDFAPRNNVESSDIVLNSLSGKMAGLMIILREQNAAQERLFSAGTLANASWKQITNFTFKTGGGAIVGYERQPVQLYRTTYWADHFKSGLAQEKCLMFYPFCTHLMPAIYDGADVGSYRMTAKDSIRFTPISVVGSNSFAVGAQMDLLIYAFRYAQFIQGNGSFRLDRLG